MLCQPSNRIMIIIMKDFNPEDFSQIGNNLIPSMVLEPGSKLYVDTRAVRGEFIFHGLYAQLGIEPDSFRLGDYPRDRQYILFSGHIGCGKSTELRRVVKDMHSPDGFFVVFLDAAIDLDPSNLQYADVLLSLAAKLCLELGKVEVGMDPVFLTHLKKWFVERVVTTIKDSTLSAEIQTGAGAGVTLPFVGGLFTKLVNSMKYGATYKDELRQVVRNTFSEFAVAFNQLIVAADAAIQEAGKGKKLLFVVDGTDRLRGDDAKRFFVDDVHQLQQIEANFIYCAQIGILSEGTQLHQRFDSVHTVPMIKLHERDDPAPLLPAMKVMREMVYKRVGPGLFDAEETVDYLIGFSGGHPRDLVRLLNVTRQFSENKRLDRMAAEKAVRDMATTFKRFLTRDDYALIREIDRSPEPESSERADRLLQNLAVLSYNDFWWRSHPVVRTLPGYNNPQ